MTSGMTGRAIRRHAQALGLIALLCAAVAPGCASSVQTGDSDALNRQGNRDADAGRYADAEDKLGRALSIREAAFPVNNADVSVSLYNLGRLYRIEGRYVAAEPLLRRALTLREQALGTESSGLVSNLNELGYLSLLRGRYGDAEIAVHAGIVQ